jgi:hypothetical protein
MRPRYYVTTWDTDKQDYTPQIGCRTGPYSIFGLRKALRRLRDLGYSADRDDPAIFVYRHDEGPWRGVDGKGPGA